MSYTQAVLYHVLDTFCVDTDRLHVTGVGNGGMFIWSKLMDRMAATLASAGESAVHGGSGLGHLLIIRNCGKLPGPRLQPDAGLSNQYHRLSRIQRQHYSDVPRS